jgi:PAS domain S-box-containing protein
VPPLRLTEFEDLYRVLVESSTDLIMVVDAEGEIGYVNSAAEEMLGFQPEELLGSPFGALVTQEFEADAAAICERAARGRPQSARTFVARRRDGSPIHLSVTATPLERGAESPGAAALIATDVSVHEQRERELGRLIRDNELILRSVGEAIVRVDPGGQITYANPAAGQILGCNHAELLGRNADALLRQPLPGESLQPVEESPIRASLRGELIQNSEETFWRPDGTSFEAMCTSAPIFEEGEVVGCVCVFSDVSDEKERAQELQWEQEWQRRIKHAIDAGWLLAYGQPIVDLQSGREVQRELLVRMRGHEGDLVLPVDFLPAAERLDVIHAIDRWMLDRALELVGNGLTVAVNVSARSLTELPMLEEVQRSLRSTGAEPTALIFEITETAAAQNSVAAQRFATEVKRLGCRLALDDFGTGFGTMTYLKSLPADFLKIDLEFVHGLRTDIGNQRIVRTIVDIARRHGQRTVAEGVEDAESAALLSHFGVDFGQGHYFGAPSPI